MATFVTSPTLQRRTLLAALPAVLLLRPALGHANPAQDAERFIITLGERTLGVLSRPGADRAERVSELASLMDEAVDLRLVARLVLGRHWRSASPAQREEYLGLFRAYARDSLAQRFTDYSGGQGFKVTGSRQVSDDDRLVSTQIVLGAGAPVTVDWRVRQIDGRMVIIDVVAEGISMLVTNRSEFDAIVNRSGMDGLLAEMRGWHRGSASHPRTA